SPSASRTIGRSPSAAKNCAARWSSSCTDDDACAIRGVDHGLRARMRRRTRAPPLCSRLSPERARTAMRAARPHLARPMDAKLAKLQGHRLSVTRMTLVSSSLQAGLLALFAWSGVVGWTIAAAFAAASIGSTGFFTFAVRRGWNLRFRDTWLMYAQ